MTNDDEEIRQLAAWKRYIYWEKQNPLKLDNEEAVLKRGFYIYKKNDEMFTLKVS